MASLTSVAANGVPAVHNIAADDKVSAHASATQAKASQAEARKLGRNAASPTAAVATWRSFLSWVRAARGRQWTLVTVIALFLALIVELFIFNYSALFFDEERYPHQVITLPQHEQLKRPMAVLGPKNNALTINDINLPLKSVYLQMGYGGRTLLKGQLYLKDDARAYAYSPVASIAVVPIAERDDSGINPLTGRFDNDGWGSPQEVAEAYLQVWPKGNVHELRLEFAGLRSEVGLLALELNKPLPVDLSLIRLALMTMVLILLYTVACTQVRQQVIAVSSRSYRWLNRGAFVAALALATFIFVAMSPWVSNPDYGFKFVSLGFQAYGTPGGVLLLPMPKTEEQIINSDAYTQLLDAFLKGQLNIDYQADPRLAYLDNTYDNSERLAKNIPFLFDRSYHDGKFYPYFGVTPLFLIYLPIYLITGMVPSMALATYIGTIMALVGLHLGSTKLTELLVERVNPLLFVILKLAFYAASIMFLVQIIFSFYALPYLTCCLCLGFVLWALSSVRQLRSYYDKPQKAEVGLSRLRALARLYGPLVLMGMSIVGIAGSRPVLEMYVVCLVPPVAWYLWCSAVDLKVKLTATVAVGVPVLIGAILLMAYNYLRFDSVFEFGLFKITTSLDNNYGKFQWSFEYIKALLFHGFFENFHSSAQFPFVLPSDTLNENLGNISTSQGSSRAGIFAFPYFWLMPLVIVLIKRYHRGSMALKQLEQFTFKRLLVWGLVATIAVTPLCQIVSAFSAGTALRYISDYTMMWTYVVLLAVLQLNFADSNHSQVGLGTSAVNFRALSYLAIISLCLVTLVEHSLLVFSGDRNDVLLTIQPELLVLFSRIFAPLSVAF
ncbi:MAG: hypothetical protein ROM54_11195 [Anaerobiospirillum sp.]|nr:hypothetical protein [Anaerobiospirillum sp.]